MPLDTDFLIDLGGTRSSRRRNEAQIFLSRHAAESFYISRITWAEFAEGAASLEDTRQALAGFACLEIREDTAWMASRIARRLKHPGLNIGDNDVLAGRYRRGASAPARNRQRPTLRPRYRTARGIAPRDRLTQACVRARFPVFRDNPPIAGSHGN